MNTFRDKIHSIFLLLFVVGIGLALVRTFYLDRVEYEREVELLRGDLEKNIFQPENHLNEMIESGDFDHYFFLSNVSESSLERIRNENTQIQDIAFINRRGFVFSQTFSDISALRLKQKRKLVAKNRSRLLFLETSGIYSLFPVLNEDNKMLGFLLIRWKPPFRKIREGQAVALANFSIDKTIVFPRRFLSLASEKKLQDLWKTSHQSEGVFTLELGENAYRFFFKSIEAKGWKIALVLPQKSLAQTPLFWIILGLVLGYGLHLLTILKFRPIKKLTRSEEYEATQEALQSLRRAVESGKKTQALIQDAVSEMPPMPLEKEIFEDESITEPDEQSETVYASEEIEEEAKPGVIELKPIVREFQYIDPFEEPPEPTKPATPERVERIRKHVLSQSGEILREISSENVSSSFMEKLHGFQRQFGTIHVNPILPALNEVYFDEILEHEVVDLLRLCAIDMGAQACALLVYDMVSGCYRIRNEHGLSKNARENFYFLKGDPIFHISSESVWLIPGENDLKNSFFKKRFVPGNIPKGLYFHSYNNVFLDAYLVFFFQEKPIPKMLDSGFHVSLFQDLAPALRAYLEEKKKVITHNFNSEMKKALIGVTELGQAEIRVLHLEFKEPLAPHLISIIQGSLQSLLEAKERFILNSPVHIILLLKATDPETVLENLEDTISIVRKKVLRYPQDGRSYYLYM